ncbi:MAG: peptidyl-tRNA hydrolase [Candidatus Altiarchaeales archaeon]|nr:peptidyl-tRNA hydrolase [Candidatus Altiarchaeales archaeon]
MELKQVIVVRSDLKLGKGKMAAQVAHASVTAADKSSWKKDWISEGQKKTVVKCSGEKELVELLKQANNAKLPSALIEDAGLTQIPAGTKTCLGIGPAPVEQIDRITGNLKLL